MATTITSQCCKMFKLISGIRQLQILHIQLNNVRMHRSLWSEPIINARVDQSNSLKQFSQKPKRPMNMFLLYLKEVTPDILSNNPGIPQTELYRKASSMWANLDPEEKSRFSLKRMENLEKYREDMKNYLDNITPEEIEMLEAKKKKEIVKKKKKDCVALGKPRKWLSSFVLFLEEQHVNRSEDIPNFFNHCVDLWAKMSEEEKEVYKEKARKQKEKYEEELDSFEQNMISMGRFDMVRKKVLTKLQKDKIPTSKKKVRLSGDEKKDNAEL